jgi:hypothetical protein
MEMCINVIDWQSVFRRYLKRISNVISARGNVNTAKAS